MSSTTSLGFVAVETDDAIYLGVAERDESLGGYFIRTGQPGRPVFVDEADVLVLVPAEEHPEVQIV